MIRTLFTFLLLSIILVSCQSTALETTTWKMKDNVLASGIFDKAEFITINKEKLQIISKNDREDYPIVFMENKDDFALRTGKTPV